MNQKKLKKIALLIGALTIAVIAILFSVKPAGDNISVTPTPEVVTTETPREGLTYADKKQINAEYTGRLYFESGLVNEEIAQGESNEKYFALTWDLRNESSGSGFLDYRNKLTDQNLIIYGHFVYADESKMFSPLHQLKEESNYEANKTIFLELENETVEYVVARVFYYTDGDATLRYYYPNYNTNKLDDDFKANEEYFNKYLTAIDKKSFYKIDEELTINDRWITLQTCVRNKDKLRLIVVAKEVNRIPK